MESEEIRTYMLVWTVGFRGIGGRYKLNEIDSIIMRDERFAITEVKRSSEGLLISGYFTYPKGVKANKQNIFSVLSDLLSKDIWSISAPVELIKMEVKML